MLETSTIHALNNISWNFPANDATSRAVYGLLDARKLHWYPATYIPEIPYSLIELLSDPGARVLDPFAGIGTTLWQAQVLGREAFGCELTVVGHGICDTLWTLRAEDTDLSEVQHEVLSVLRSGHGVDLTGAFLGTTRGALLEPWFSKGTLAELAFVAAAEEMLVSDAARKLLRLSTSAILASVSEQRRGWGCIADNMRPKPEVIAMAPPTRGAIDKIAQRVKAVIRAVAESHDRLAVGALPIRTDDIGSHLFSGDCVRSEALATEDFYDLVVTSPPYPEMVDYSTAQRLSYYWHGIVPERDVTREIGARRRRFSSKSLAQYSDEMGNAMHRIASSVKQGGRVAMVVPSFSTGAETDPRASVVREAIESSTDGLLKLSWEKDRVLPASRRHINQKWASLRREQIRVYERIR